MNPDGSSFVLGPSGVSIKRLRVGVVATVWLSGSGSSVSPCRSAVVMISLRDVRCTRPYLSQGCEPVQILYYELGLSTMGFSVSDVDLAVVICLRNVVVCRQ